MVLLSNSKPNYHRNILTTINSAGIPSLICFISLPQAPSNHWEYYVCNKSSRKSVHFQFQGNRRETKRIKKIIAFCCSSRIESPLVWLILPLVLESSSAIPLQLFGCTPYKWQMYSHGNRPVIPLLVCQMKSTSASEEPAGDLTDLTSVQEWDFLKKKLLLDCVWALAVIVRHMHIT